MSKKELKRQVQDEPSLDTKEPEQPAPEQGAADKSKYVFKIVRADPKNDFDFENVADK